MTGLRTKTTGETPNPLRLQPLLRILQHQVVLSQIDKWTHPTPVQEKSLTRSPKLPIQKWNSPPKIGQSPTLKLNKNPSLPSNDGWCLSSRNSGEFGVALREPARLFAAPSSLPEDWHIGTSKIRSLYRRETQREIRRLPSLHDSTISLPLKREGHVTTWFCWVHDQ